MSTTEPKNIYQKINLIMGEVTHIQKTQKQGMRYAIIEHDDVTSLLSPACQKQGIVYHPKELTFAQIGNRTEVALLLVFVNVDNPSDQFTVPSFGYGIDDSDKGPGKAISYAVKYGLLKTFGLQTGDDPDKDQNSSFKEPTPVKNEAPTHNTRLPGDGMARNLDLEVLSVTQKESAKGKPFYSVVTSVGSMVSFADLKPGHYTATVKGSLYNGRMSYTIDKVEKVDEDTTAELGF